MYDLAENDDFDREMIATYEEVAKLYPRPGVHRPVVLIGPPGNQLNKARFQSFNSSISFHRRRSEWTCKENDFKRSWEISLPSAM